MAVADEGGEDAAPPSIARAPFCMAGRYAQLTDPDLLARRPYWKYIHSEAVTNPRPQHLAWSGLVLRHDHPFWQTHFPPNGFGCQCRVTSVRAPGPDDATTPPEGWDKVGENGTLPGVGKGWAYAPGRSVAEGVRDVVEQKVTTLPAELGAALAETAATVAGVRAETDAAFSKFFDAAEAAFPQTQHAMMVVGAMKPAWVEKMGKAGVAPATAELVMRDDDIVHMIRTQKVAPVPPEFLRQLPQHLDEISAVILDTTHKSPALMLVWNQPGARTKVVVQVNYQIKKPVRGVFNVIGTARVLDDAAIKAIKGGLGKGYELIDGKL
ncbi:hypothetical protein AGMMS49960_07000 [Betaproteobacteria bacterium]|nr:hypothetical protein AGMMS49960_07000 [Betaproteobacteria bacterium]GHU22620.1 hypothetical protein AGMMS50243_22560 [Betaproteobacteria bacterium]